LQAPDHELPAWLELVLTATDSLGASASTSIELQPMVGTLTVLSSPNGIELGVGSVDPQAAPFQHPAAVGGTVSVVAPLLTEVGNTDYGFWTWSDGGARVHDLVVPGNMALTAEYRRTIDLALAVDSPPPTFLGGTLRYDIVVSNLGDNPATLPGVAVALPRKIEFLSAVGQGWSCTAAELVLCNGAMLQPQAASPVLSLSFRAIAVGDAMSSVKALRGAEFDDNSSNDVVLVLNQIVAVPPLFQDDFESRGLGAWSNDP
jgi:uncharacterized repeat protein (TIGR01451 family)